MADLTQIYGPLYGGMLMKQGMNTQNALAQNQSLQGTLGLLSTMARQQEQSKLLQEQVNIAKLKAEKEARLMGFQGNILEQLAAEMQGGGQAPLGLLSGVNPATAGVGDMIGAASAQNVPQAPNMLSNPRTLGLLSLSGMPGANTAIQAAKYGQDVRAFENMSAAQRAEAEARDRQHALERERFALEQKKFGGLSAEQRETLARRDAELRDRGITPPNTGAVQFPSSGQTQPSQMTPAQVLGAERQQALARGDLNAVAEIDRELSRMGGRPGANPAPVNNASLNAPQSPNPQVSPEQRRKIEAEREADKPKNTLSFRRSTSTLDELISAVDQLLANDDGLSRITGMQGVNPMSWPGGLAQDADRLLESIRSQESIRAIQAMRDASTTGGAVGQVTQQEWPRLEAATRPLANRQSKEQLVSSLKAVKRVAQDAKQAIGEQYTMLYGNVPVTPAGGDQSRSSGNRVIKYDAQGRRL